MQHIKHTFSQLASITLFSVFFISCDNDSVAGPVVSEEPNSSSATAITPTDSLSNNSSSSTTPSTESTSSSQSQAPSSSSFFDWNDFCWPGTDCTAVSSSSIATTPAPSSSSVDLSGVVMGSQMWDQRDNALYDLETLNGKVWTVNMNYQTNAGSSCYGDDSLNCASYGRLYTYITALDVCPSGWHLPTLTEVNAAVTDGLRLQYAGREKSGTWDFAEEMGFMWTVNPTGTVDTDNCGSLPSGSCAVLLVDHNPDYNDKAIKTQLDSREKGFSVRCVQN